VSAALPENKAAKAGEIISGNHPERCGEIHIAVQQNPLISGIKAVTAAAAPLPVFAQYGRLIG
jgi:hypothetical protein